MSRSSQEVLHARYQFTRNGVIPGQSETIASFNLRKAHVRRAIARDVMQSLEEEQTFHGAPTDRIKKVSYTTMPVLPSPDGWA
jgi:hypothetical protein